MVHIKDPLLLIRMTFPSFPSKKKDNMHLVPCSIPYLPHTLWAMMLTLEELIEFRGLYILEMRRKGGRSHTHHGRLRGTKTGHSTVGDGPFCDTRPQPSQECRRLQPGSRLCHPGQAQRVLHTGPILGRPHPNCRQVDPLRLILQLRSSY